MSDEQLLHRVTCDPGILGGKPVVRGTRLNVELILNLLGHGATADEILREYQGLSLADLRACQLFAAQSLADATFLPLATDGA
jgi:uncharacterized protein (DUF433 family)